MKIAPHSRSQRGFTLIEMMITLAVFILLAGAVFGIMTGVLQSTSALQDNQDRRDQVEALNAYFKKKLGELTPASTLVSYERGDGEGLLQNGILFGDVTSATAIDAKSQPNGYYVLRLTTLTPIVAEGQTAQDARQVLLQAVTTDDPSLVWSPLIKDIKTLDWKFLDYNQLPWLDVWNNTTKPTLVEFSMQPAGDLLSTTMDFWIPKVDPVSLNIPAAVHAP
jgi:prepilin-type N-terminal cleavage/methylation domain-containing protein